MAEAFAAASYAPAYRAKGFIKRAIMLLAVQLALDSKNP
jgi:hypothetical protein